MKYTGHDLGITDGPEGPLLSFQAMDNYVDRYIDGDDEVLNSVPQSGGVEFQFPPKIFTDNRSGEWKGENVKLPGRNPLYTFSLTGAREFVLEFEYIVTSFTENETQDNWSIIRIKRLTNFMRGYFTFNRLNDAESENQIVYFRYKYYTGPELWTCLLKSANIKQSETIVGNADTGYYPLHTKVSLDMRVWTTGRLPGEGEDVVQQNIRGLKDEPVITDLWF